MKPPCGTIVSAGLLFIALASGCVGAEKPGSGSAVKDERGIDVRFKSDAVGVELAGTLRLPEGEGPFPCLILITGSGAQDRDEALLGMRPFFDIAEALALRGWATLRYDDRGVGGSSGSFAGATSADFARDAVGAYRFAAADTRIDARRIAIGGHSEGGYVAALAENALGSVYGLVLIAAPGVRGYDILVDQSTDILAAMGSSAAVIRSAQAANTSVYDAILSHESFPEALVRAELKKAGVPADQIDAQAGGLSDPWFKAFLSSDPAAALAKTRSPVLAINGSKDVQVRADKNLAAIESACREAGITIATVKMDGLNHLFQKAGSGLPAEYASLSRRFSPEAISIIADWLERLPKP